MSEWYTAADLAGLPGMPATSSGVIRSARNGGWKSRRRVKGKGSEYFIKSLPSETRAYLEHQAAQAVLATLPAPAETMVPAIVRRDIPTSGELTTWQRERRDARLLLLSLLDELTATLGSERRAAEQIEAMAKAGTLPNPYAEALVRANARSGHVTKGANIDRTLSRSTISRWSKEWRAALNSASDPVAGANVLAPKAPARRDNPVWLSPLLALYQDPLRKPTVAACYRQLANAESSIHLPSLRTVQWRIEQLPEVVREWGRQGVRARRAIQPFVRRSADGLWPMDVVAVDGHALKAYVQHPLSGDYFHPEVTTYIDIATRVIVGWSAWLAESQFTIWLALRHTVLDVRRGIPAIQYSDNGAYTGAEHLGVLARLGITPVNSRAYNPQANGAVERINQTIWREVARSLFPTGDQVDQEAFKKAMRRMKEGGECLPSWDSFLAVAQARIDEYNSAPHSSLKRGRAKITPNQAWDEALNEGWKPTLLEGDALHDLLPSEERVCRRGEVVIQGRIYFSRELMNYHGETVQVASDPADGSQVWISDRDGRLICTAERNGNTRHYIAEDKLSHAIEKRRVSAEKRVEKRLEQVRSRETPVIEGQRIDLPDLVLPRPGDMAPVIDLTPSHIAPAVAPVVEHAPEPVATANVLPMRRSYIDDLDNDAARYEAWTAIKARLEAGETVTEREHGFFEAFGRSEYCRRTQKLWADWEAQLAAQSAR